MEYITKSNWNKIKIIVKEKTPYSIYKYFYDNFNKEKEDMLVNSFFYYLCYLNKQEFDNLKINIENILKKDINFEYHTIPLFNETNNKKEENVSLIKPKVEFENLSKNKILDMINKQNIKTKENLTI